jgi:hypothetical protein
LVKDILPSRQLVFTEPLPPLPVSLFSLKKDQPPSVQFLPAARTQGDRKFKRNQFLKKTSLIVNARASCTALQEGMGEAMMEKIAGGSISKSRE